MSGERMKTWRIGEVEVTRIVEVWNREDPLSMLLEEGTAAMMLAYPWLHPHHATPDGNLLVNFQGFAIKAGPRRIIVDTCIYILITKLDLIAPGARACTHAALIARLRPCNASARVGAADDPALDPMSLMRRAAPDPGEGTRAAMDSLGNANRHTHAEHVHDTAIASFSLIRETPLPREALQLLLSPLEQHLGPGPLRVKGLVNVAEEPDHRRLSKARGTCCTISLGSGTGPTPIAGHAPYSSFRALRRRISPTCSNGSRNARPLRAAGRALR